MAPANSSWPVSSYGTVTCWNQSSLGCLLTCLESPALWKLLEVAGLIGCHAPSERCAVCHSISLVHCDLFQTHPNRATCLTEDSPWLLGHSGSPSCLPRAPWELQPHWPPLCFLLPDTLPRVLPRPGFMAAFVFDAVSLPLNCWSMKVLRSPADLLK